MKKINRQGCKYCLFLFSICFFAFCLLIGKAEANNLAVSSVSLGNVSLGQTTAKVQFNISWDNSWRTTTNYDAAWVFIKYSTDAGVTWNHATLKTSGTNPAGFSQGTGTGLDIVVPTDKMGAFLQRSANASGSVSTTNIQLVWDYAANGVSGSATVRVKVFAIEMVYIPQGSFYAGDNATSTASFKAGSSDTTPWYIQNENAISVTNVSSGGFYYVSAGNTGEGATGSAFTIPAAFPKGYAAFYMMKYDISQGQYADFLNTLTSTQASTRNPAATTYRYTITGTYPNFSASRPDRACNWLSWADVAAYADWAALRPLTELEFEKAARGASAAVAGEYAWGNTTITQAVAISGTENGTETITTAGANCNYGSATFTGTGSDLGQGPLRCGIFATGSSTRAASGAGYYGVMDLSGNLWKRPVTVGNATGRAFTGLHGDGVLDGTGNANTANWPDTTATGAGDRGGSWYDAAAYERTSDRFNAAVTGAARNINIGGRAVRTSP